MSDLNATKAVIVQPLVPLYRRMFFEKMKKKIGITIYVYNDDIYLKKEGFYSSVVTVKYLNNFKVGKALFIDIRPLLFGSHNIIVLPSEFKLFSNWIILLFGKLFGKKIILWGHGINAHFYNEQTERMPLIRKLMYQLADGAWFYTENERSIWCKLMPSLKSVALGNTVDIPHIDSVDSFHQRQFLKKKYSINTDINFIFCARFKSPRRRVDLLLRSIERMNCERFGFIIIGSGDIKPDFSGMDNVYDFGAVYDGKIKNELFSLADIYFQPAWTGLSIVEAMAYGKPVFTFKRSADVSQGVEYGYIESGVNGMVFDDVDELINFIEHFDIEAINALGKNAYRYYCKNLSMDKMVENALVGIEMVTE